MIIWKKYLVTNSSCDFSWIDFWTAFLLRKYGEVDTLKCLSDSADNSVVPYSLGPHGL